MKALQPLLVSRRSHPLHCLLVQVLEATAGIVLALQSLIRRAIVDLPEGFLVIVGGRVESLLPLKRKRLRFYLLVVVSFWIRAWHRVPEPEVDVELPGVERIQVVGDARVVAAERANPDGKHADLAEQEIQE